MNAPVPCPEFEARILEGVDAAADPVWSAHLLICPGCRALAEAWGKLDRRLERELPVPRLSAGFDRALRARIAAEGAPAGWAEREARKRALEQEFRNRVAGWRFHRLSLAGWLDVLGYGLVTGVFAYTVCRWLPRLFSAPWVTNAGPDQGTLTSVGLALVMLAAGLAFSVVRLGGANRFAPRP